MQIAELFFSVEGQGFDQLNGKIDSSISKLSNVGKAFTAGVTVPLVAIAGTIVKTTTTFDKEMSKVKAITGETGDNFDMLRDLALDMGSDTTKSATEAAEAINYMGLAGWDLTQIQEGLAPVLKVSEAGFMDLGTASDLVTDSMSALGITTEDLTRYLDIAATAQTTSNQTMEQFLNAMVTAGGTFKMFNIPLEEAGGLLGILANRGFKGTEAGNALTSVFANLTSGVGQAGEAMADLNIEVYDSNGNFRGATTILNELNEKFDGMTEAQRNTYIQMIGGKTRTKELNALLNGTKEELDDLTDGLYNSEGALSTMSDTMKDNFAGQLTSISSKLEGIAITVGDRLTPYLEIAANKVEKLANWFYNLSGPVKDLIIVLGLIAASIGPLILLFTGLIGVVGFGITAFTTISGAIAAIGAPVIFAVAAITMLIGVYTTIAGVIVGVAYKTGLLQLAFNNIKNIALSIIAIFQGDLTTAFQILTEKFGLTGEEANLFMQKIIGVRNSLFRVKEVIENVIALLETIFTADKQEMIDLLREKFGFTKDEAERFSNKVLELKNQIIELGSKIKAYIVPILLQYADKIKAAADFVYEHRKEIALFIEKIIEMGSEILSLAKTVYTKFKEIESSIEDAMDSASEKVEKVIGFFKDLKDSVGGVIDKLKNLSFPSLPNWLTGNADGNAAGSIDYKGGWSWVGEQGPELMYIPQGSDIYSNSQSKNMLNNTKPTTTSNSEPTAEIFNLYGDIVIDAQSVEDFNSVVNTLKSVKREKNMR